MDKSIEDIPKLKRGRKRTTGRGEGILLRVHAPLLKALDAYAENQPEPKPSRQEIIRLALVDWLTGLGLLKHRDDPEGTN